jgi:hypothetical protein
MKSMAYSGNGPIVFKLKFLVRSLCTYLVVKIELVQIYKHKKINFTLLC